MQPLTCEQELVSDVILAIKEQHGATSTQLGHALHLAVSSFNNLSEKRGKKAVNRSCSSISELVTMLNEDYPPCLGVLIKGDIENAVGTYFNCKQHFDQVNQD